MEKLEKYIELKETIETFLKKEMSWKKEKIYMNQSNFITRLFMHIKYCNLWGKRNISRRIEKRNKRWNKKME